MFVEIAARGVPGRLIDLSATSDGECQSKPKEPINIHINFHLKFAWIGDHAPAVLVKLIGKLGYVVRFIA